jgi:hypothetical protein
VFFGVKIWQIAGAASIGLMIGSVGYSSKNMFALMVVLSLGLTCVIGGLVGSWSWLTEADKRGRVFKRAGNN